MHDFWHDLKYASRLFRRSRGFTVTAVAALALGIAANTAIFSVVNTILLKPFAYPHPEQIVMFQSTFRQGMRTGSASPTLFNWWRQQSESFQDISAYTFGVANWTSESFPEQIPTMRITADFLRLCGATVLGGRLFTAADDLPNASKTAVLAWPFWQRRFGGDPHVIGRRMTLNSERYEIIGVLGPGLQQSQITEQSLISGDVEIDEPPDVYLPFQLDPESSATGRYFNVAARLKPGVTLAAANARLQASYAGYERKWPNDHTPGGSFAVQLLQQAVVSGVRDSLLILWGAVGFVLLIACANVANLLLARAAARKREITIRAVVGAGRRRLVRQLLTESLMLSLTGGALGLAAGYSGVRALLTILPGSIPRIGNGGANVGLDWRVFGFTLALSILTGVVFGLVPALDSSRADLSRALKESGNRSGTGLRHNRTRRFLVMAEAAFALVLLIGAGLLIRSFIAIRQVNPGFEARGVLTIRMSLTGPQFAGPAAVTQVIDEGLRRIRALPEVELAGAACCVPLEDRLNTGFQISGRRDDPASRGAAGWTLASAGYFETLRIPVLRGRSFVEQDDRGPLVAIINQALAKQFWPQSDPLRGQIIVGRNQAPHRVIGVVGDVRDSALNRQPRPMLYFPIAQMAARESALMSETVPWAWLIRTRVAPLSLSSRIQNELRTAGGGLPVAHVRTLEETLSRSTAARDFNTLVLAIFGCSALLLAAIGIYGLMAYSVAQRTQEIGIRLALGAPADRIRNMVVVQGLRPALAGIACGLAAALGLTRLLTGFLFGVKPWDPTIFVAVPLVLLAVALFAVWIPARRASRVDPIGALRCE